MISCSGWSDEELDEGMGKDDEIETKAWSCRLRVLQSMVDEGSGPLLPPLHRPLPPLLVVLFGMP